MKRMIISVLAAITMAAAQAQYKMPTIEVWPREVPDAKAPKSAPTVEAKPNQVYLKDVTNPMLEIFKPSTTPNGRAVIVCPGGAYAFLSYDKEGQEIARWLAGQGYTAYVLAYRCPNNRAGALQDIQRAIRTVRAQGHEVRGREGFSQVGVIGFSAGASLSCRAATRFAEQTYTPQDAIDTLSARPDFGILIYPAYLDEGPDHTLTPELTVTRDTPPLFVFGTEDDKAFGAPSSIVIADAMRRADAPVELHYLTKGGHGYGMRSEVGKVWAQLAEAWLKTL